MSDYILILVIIGIIYWLSLDKTTRAKKKKDLNSSKVGKTTIHRVIKNEAKIKIEAEDIDFEEIIEHEK